MCQANYRVESGSCIACPTGGTNEQGDDPRGADKYYTFDASAAPANGGIGDCPSSLANTVSTDVRLWVHGVRSIIVHFQNVYHRDVCGESLRCFRRGVLHGEVSNSDCTTLESGSTCYPTYITGYTLSGSRQCSLGTLTDTAVCSPNACTASASSSKDGTDGNFYCINGGTLGGTSVDRSCTSCNAGYGGDSCDTAGACMASTDLNKNSANGTFYCINGGTVGGTAGAGSCTCTSCNTG